MAKSKWSIYDEQIRDILTNNPMLTPTGVAKLILGTTESQIHNKDVDCLKTYINRNGKRILDQYEGVYNATDNLDIDNTTVKHLWLKNKGVSAFVKNPNYVEPTDKDYSILRETLINDLKQYAPTYQPIQREFTKESHLFIFDPADIHIGKLCSAFEVGETYNNQIAVQRVLNGCNGLLNRLKGYNIDKVLFVIGNDILHIDNPKRTTTSGTPQDTDGMWHSNFLIAKQLYVDIIEKLLSVADVHVIFNPSNHDYTNGFFLAQVIEAHFRNCEQVTFNCSISHRKYYVYGSNLIGTTHGDGAKTEALPLLMANESKDWVNCKHKYFYIHHFHHKISKDYTSVCVESLRSPSGTDSWHHRNGYQFSPQAVEGFIHCKNNGQVARLTHLF